jgi:uncharacterized protein (TIGR02118 family)
MVKIITLIKKKEGLSDQEFYSYWEKDHGPLIARIFPGVERYIQNHAVKLPGGGRAKYDGVVEIWYKDMESWRRASDFYQGDEGKVIIDDEAKFIDRDAMVFVVVEEKVIVG